MQPVGERENVCKIAYENMRTLLSILRVMGFSVPYFQREIKFQTKFPLNKLFLGRYLTFFQEEF